MHCKALAANNVAANNVIQQQAGPFIRCLGVMGVYSGGLRAVYVY